MITAEERAKLREKAYAQPLLEALNRMELRTLETFGKSHIRSMIRDVLAYDQALEAAMKAEK